jgi:predicted SprT family Zn-dependent metalloprotease
LNSEECVRNTVLHELAHALAGFAAHHGPDWQWWCRKLGARPERLNTEAVVIYNVFADCQCGPNTHKKMRMPKGTRICLRCRQELTWRRI